MRGGGSDVNITRSGRSWISILILTRNEGHHIRRCIRNAFRVTDSVFVVDSDSADGTATLAKQEGATVVVGRFNGFAEKLNWCLGNLGFDTPWVLRLDADEILTDGLICSLRSRVEDLSVDITGVFLRRQLWFMGKWMVHGGMYPTYSMRLWRTGCVQCEVRDLDEHMLLNRGRAVSFNLDIIDNPRIDLTQWIEKHNLYASLEAITAAKGLVDLDLNLKPRLFGNRTERVRWVKVFVFYKLPLFIRPVFYFLYRYVVRLGFLDGRRGFLFHFLHGFWYRVLVDGKIYEKRMLATRKWRSKKNLDLPEG